MRKDIKIPILQEAPTKRNSSKFLNAKTCTRVNLRKKNTYTNIQTHTHTYTNIQTHTYTLKNYPWSNFLSDLYNRPRMSLKNCNHIGALPPLPFNFFLLLVYLFFSVLRKWEKMKETRRGTSCSQHLHTDRFHYLTKLGLPLKARVN